MILSKKVFNLLAVIVLVVIGLTLLLFYVSTSDSQNKKVSIPTMIGEYTKDKRDVILTVGVLKAGKTNFKVFGLNSKQLEPVEYEYEIGSISKTFTASILCKAIADGLIDINEPTSKYLQLDPDTFYPTVLSLATHTSGYGEYPFSPSELSKEELEKIDYDFNENKINIYQGINQTEIMSKVRSHVLKDEPYEWEYSNFGFAVLGTVLGEVYDSSYKTIAENFIKNDLGLDQTRLGNGTGNLTNYWSWNDDDTYFAAGGYVSTVTDLLKYGQLHISDSPEYLALSHKIYQTSKKDGLSMGLGWIIDPETNYLWHNGGTSSYQSFIGIDKEHKTVVVVLSNYPAKDDSENEEALDIMGYSLLNNLRDEVIDEISVFEN